MGGGARARVRVACLCLSLSHASCRGDAPAATTEPSSVLLGPENVVVVEQTRIDTGPMLSGSLEARERSVITAEAAGSVESVRVEIGDRVKRGQLMARIESRALGDAVRAASAALAAREQTYALAERQLERVQRLVAGGALAPHELELAQSALSSEQALRAQARAALVSAREQRQAALVHAPLDGVVSQRTVSQGDIVTLGAPLFVVIDPSSMRLSASVPSEALGTLKLGAPVEFRVHGLGDQQFTGSIERIGPAADPVTRQIPLLVSLPNPTGRLVAGLFAEGRVAARQKTGLVLPTAALVSAGASASVRRLSDDRVEVVPVTLGIEDLANERVEITSGLAPGDRVLTGGARDLDEGTLVRLHEAGAQSDVDL